jgi:hypothetical protein
MEDAPRKLFAHLRRNEFLFTCFRVENSFLKFVQTFLIHSMFLYTVHLKRGLNSQLCKLNCWCIVLYWYAAVNIPINTTAYDVSVFDISRKAYFTIIPNTIPNPS